MPLSYCSVYAMIKHPLRIADKHNAERCYFIMPRTKTVVILCALFLACGHFASAEQSFSPGERITYSIKKYGVRVGKATLIFHGLIQRGSRKLLLIEFNATSLNFLDREEIYADPRTFFPVMVKRDLNIWGKKEQIIEYYDAQAGKVTIEKHAGSSVTQEIIKHDYPLENIYCFLYKFRAAKTFPPKTAVRLNLPTAQVLLKVRERTSIRMAGKRHQAFFLQSQSKEYRLWFADDQRRTPLRIDGAIGLGSASLMMTSYHAASHQRLANQMGGSHE